MASSDFCKHHICMQDINIHAHKTPIHIHLFFFTGRWMERTNPINLPSALNITHSDMYIYKHTVCIYIYIITNKIFLKE